MSYSWPWEVSFGSWSGWSTGRNKAIGWLLGPLSMKFVHLVGQTEDVKDEGYRWNERCDHHPESQIFELTITDVTTLLLPAIAKFSTHTFFVPVPGQLLFYLDMHAHAHTRGCVLYGNRLPSLMSQAGRVRKVEQMIHPQKLAWNLEMMVSNRNLLFQGSIFRFHVCFGGCSGQGLPSSKVFCCYTPWN